jgi:hypothetical protein
MANGDTQDKDTSKKEKTKVGVLGADLTKLGETIETLFGKPSAAPMGTPSTGGGAPPSLTAPPSGAGARFDPRGAGGGALPSAPSGVLSPQPRQPAIQSMGTEFATKAGAQGAVASSALSSVVGALHDISSQKKQEKIQHAEFLYNLVKSAYESGDQQTANIILQDDKNRQLIEKYLTGNLPRVPGSPTREEPLYAGRKPGSSDMKQTGSMDVRQQPGKLGDINKPGGPALPRPSQQSQLAAAVQNMIMEGLKNKDPRILDKVLGEGSSLSEKDYATAQKAKFGIELAPAQLQALDAKSQLALSETKADVLKYVIGQGAQTERAIAVAKIHAGAEVETGLGHDKARLEVAKNYRDFLLKVKGTTPDKMEMVMYQGLSKLYTDMAKNSITQSAKLMKDSPEMAKQLETEAKEYVKKAEGMKAQYEAGKFLDDLLKGGTPEGGESDEPDNSPDSTEP